MTRKCFMAGALLLALTTMTGVLSAQRGNRGGRWELLGEANVDGAADHDFIRVGRGDGMFRAVQMRVRNSAIEFDHVVIRYGNGQSEPIEVRDVIRAGGQTRAIDLPGERRVVQGVELWYKRGNWNARRRPKVLLYGMR